MATTFLLLVSSGDGLLLDKTPRQSLCSASVFRFNNPLFSPCIFSFVASSSIKIRLGVGQMAAGEGWLCISSRRVYRRWCWQRKTYQRAREPLSDKENPCFTLSNHLVLETWQTSKGLPAPSLSHMCRLDACLTYSYLKILTFCHLKVIKNKPICICLKSHKICLINPGGIIHTLAHILHANSILPFTDWSNEHFMFRHS